MGTAISRVHLLLLISGVVLLLVFLLWKSQAVDNDTHGHFTEALHQLKQLDVNLNQDLLKIRNGLLANYDSITETLDKIKDIRERLTQFPSFIDRQGRSELSNLLMLHAQALTDKEDTIERLKTSNAALKNSLDYLPKLIQETAKQAATSATRAELSPILTDLLQNVLVYNLNGDESPLSSIVEQTRH